MFTPSSTKKYTAKQYAAGKIREARKLARKSQKKLGDELGVSDKTVSAWESGRAEPSLDMLYDIGKATSQPINFFLRDQKGEYSIPSKLSEVAKRLEELKAIMRNLD